MPNMVNGAKCWFGINTIMESSEANGIWKDDCADAPFYVNTYLAFNIVFNILIIVILKHGSANILWMASTVIVPLSNIAFSLDFMPGHKPLTIFDTIGLVVIMAGLLVYRFMVPIHKLYRKLTGTWSDDDETEAELAAQLAGKAAEGSQTKFLGLNQAEALNTLIDTRVWKAQRRSLYRTPQQIRGTLLLKLGIPPSPMISMGSRGSPSQNPNAKTSPQISVAMSPRNTDRSKFLVSPLPRAPRSQAKGDKPNAVVGIANPGKKKGSSAEI
jgi:hypothetical protein